MARDQGLIDSVADANVKTVTETSAWSNAAVMQMFAQTAADYSAHRNRLTIMAEAELANSIAASRAATAETIKAIGDASGLAEKISELLAALSSNQQGAKVAQSTPPETATGK